MDENCQRVLEVNYDDYDSYTFVSESGAVCCAVDSESRGLHHVQHPDHSHCGSQTVFLECEL